MSLFNSKISMLEKQTVWQRELEVCIQHVCYVFANYFCLFKNYSAILFLILGLTFCEFHLYYLFYRDKINLFFFSF